MPGRTIAVIPPPSHDLPPRTDWCRWAVLSLISQPLLPGSIILPRLAFPDQESSEYCRQLRTSSCRGRSVGQERRRRAPLPKEEEGALTADRAVPARGFQLPMKTILCCAMPLAFRPGFPIPLPTSPWWGPLVTMRTGIGAATLSRKSTRGPGLRNPPRRFEPAMKRWTLGLRGHRKKDWGCLPSGIRSAHELVRSPRPDCPDCPGSCGPDGGATSGSV